MARTTSEDYFNSFNFHLLDVTRTGGFSNLNVPFLALTPQIGFKSITAPSISLETQEVRPGNLPYSIDVIKRGKVDALTLQRGVLTGDDEFYQWIRKAQHGRGIYRRDLALIQIHGQIDSRKSDIEKIGIVSSLLVSALASNQRDRPVISAATGLAASALDWSARVWLLKGCVPTRYKAAQDFDGSGEEISVAELDISISSFSEFVLGTPLRLREVRNALR